MKIFKFYHEALKSFDLSFKKDALYFKLSLVIFLYYEIRHVVKYSFTNRIFVLKK